MDSSNIHYKSHKVVVCSSSPLNDGPYNFTATTAAAAIPHVWTTTSSNSFLNEVSNASAASNEEEALMNLRNPRLLQNDGNLVMTSLINHPNNAGNFNINHEDRDQDQHDNHQLLLQLNSQMIKQEAALYPNNNHNNNNLYGRLFNFNDINNQASSPASLEESSNSSSVITSSSRSSRQQQQQQSCSQIYPTINVSEFLNNIQQSQSQPQTQPDVGAGGSSMGTINYSNCFGLNFQGLDLFNPARGGFGSSFHQPYHHQEEDIEYSKINHQLQPAAYGMDFMKQSLDNTFQSGGTAACNLTGIDGKMEFLNKRVGEIKKNEAINSSEAKTGKKRSRSVESRASPPLKVFQVRKEKLGDRIAALQQLVAPFGKTDTASVLMEAIGYIKFLQNQVETLSVPYLKSSRNKNTKAAQHGGYVDSKSEEQKQDLRSKGLCLVPLSCLSYVTDGGGGAMWPPPHFG